MKTWIGKSVVMTMLLFSCSGGKKLMNKNLAYIYYNDPTIIHPDYRVYHENDTLSRLYFKFNSKEALYIKKQRDSLYSAEFSLHYKLFNIEDNKKLLDSATLHLSDQKSKQQQRYLSGSIPFKALIGQHYYLELTLNDKVRDQAVQNYFLVDKENRLSRQNFLVTDEQGKISFTNYFSKEVPVIIKSNSLSKTGKVMGRYYNRDFELPAPPFSGEGPGTFEYAADSLFTISQHSDSTFQLIMGRPGIYHLQLDTSTREGLTLFQFDGSFPLVREVEDMIEPLRYLTTRQEFRNLTEKGGTKESVDEFWYSVAGNRERGRAIIKAYYGRVQEANQFFTSYVEGWKTDRGLIYIIYGPPNVIYKTLESENWIYGEQNNVLSVNFTFYKIENPFTENDYYLSRSPVYKSSWYRAVDSWRQGKVY